MATAARPSPATVLVVDDEPILRMNAVDMIEDAGFSAVDAANADEAIAILSSRSDIRVLFTDINMPGSMDGLKLAAAVRDRRPPIDIIITSGQVAPAQRLIPARGRFFSKPYSEAALVRTIRDLVA